MEELNGCDNAVTIDETEKCTDCDSPDSNPHAPAPLPDDESENDRVKYYVVRRIEGPFTTKRDVAKFIEDEIEKGLDREVLPEIGVIRGRPCALSFETKAVIK